MSDVLGNTTPSPQKTLCVVPTTTCVPGWTSQDTTRSSLLQAGQIANALR